MTRLLLDAMLGRLRSYLRICGHDTAYALDRGIEADDRIAALAREESRRLLTRDRSLAGRVEGSVLLESHDYRDQLCELREAGVALDPATPDRCRCGRCNGRLERSPDGADRPDYVPDDAGPVRACVDCGQLFWQGSHWDRVTETLAGL